MIRRIALAATLALAVAPAAFAQAPQVPNPANPFPMNPIATDGTPLPSQASVDSPYGDQGTWYIGRSVSIASPADLLGVVGGAPGR